MLYVKDPCRTDSGAMVEFKNLLDGEEVELIVKALTEARESADFVSSFCSTDADPQHKSLLGRVLTKLERARLHV